MPGVATASPSASTNRGRVVIIAGPPCSGKGTQCARLAEAQGWVHISTGDVFRSEVAAGTELGLQAKEYLDAGAFVPDDLVIGYIVGRLAEPEVQARGVLLDGYPRTAEQAQALLARVHVDATIMIDVNDKSLLLRAAERRVDTLTGKTYHLTHEPPPPDIPLTRLARRDLDDPASFKVRLDTHRTQLRRVAQVIHNIHSVDGLRAVGDVTSAIIHILDQVTPEQAPAPAVAPIMTCAVCLSEPADFLVTPCGHQCGCEACLEQIRGTTKRCPICRLEFTTIQRVFRSGNEEGVPPASAVAPPCPATSAAHPPIEDTMDVPLADDEWPEEQEDGGAAVEPPLKLDIAPAFSVGADGGSTTVTVSIHPPEGDGERAQADICCVIDVSGSMRALATFEDEEGNQKSDGLTVLDLVKHAVRTVMHMLGDRDRLSLVSFSTKAQTVLPLTAMTAAGRAEAMAALDRLQPGGTTNIWDGIHSGMESLRPKAEPGRASSLLLLTDGQPNVVPPKGHIAEVRDYKDEFADFSFQLNTFGFGYNLDSMLLSELAVEGGGTSAFIPDAVIVGTTFVNCVANVLSTFTQEATLSLTAVGGATFDGDVLGAHAVSEQSWGRAVSLGPLQLGQTRAVSVPMHLLRSDDGCDGTPYLEAVVTYSSCCEASSMGQPGRAEATGLTRSSTPDALVGMMRSEAVDAGMRAVSAALASKGQSATTEMQTLCGTLNSLTPEGAGAVGADGRRAVVDGRLIALKADANGRMTKALQGQARFKRWGVHYLRALIRAHQIGLCTNFMDTGLQFYGGSRFKTLRDEGDAIFLALPPPKPSVAPPTPTRTPTRSSGYGQAAAPVAAAAPQMSTYYAGSGGGCFGAVSTVLVVGAAGETTTTAVADVRAGDTVVCADGTATVKVVVEIARDASQPPLRRLPGGLHITARHPVRVNGVWTSPAALSNTSASAVVDKVFNFVLDSSHVMLVNGVECVTWSHGFVEKTIRHPFYGTDAVLKSLAATDPAGFASGYVRLAGCLRALKTGAVVGMLGEQHAEAVATAAAC